MIIIKIEIPQWKDITKWFLDKFCFPRRKVVAEYFEWYNEELASKLGDYLYEAMKKAGIFQAKHLRMMQIGQRSGETDVVLKKISSYYEEDTLTHMHRILGAIEPTLVIFFSLMVGLILLSVIMPLIGIMSSIG